MKLLYDHHELRRICQRRVEAPPALEALAEHVSQNANMFAQTGPATLGQAESERRQQRIDELAQKISDLADKARDGLVSYLEFDNLLGALHDAGFYPKGDLVSAVARTLGS